MSAERDVMLSRVAQLEEALFDACLRGSDGGRGCGLDSPSRLCERCSVAAEGMAGGERWESEKDIGRYRRAIRSLVAVIDRDGGQAQVGLSDLENAKRAESVVLRLIAAAEGRS